jgi:hypothetical protein
VIFLVTDPLVIVISHSSPDADAITAVSFKLYNELFDTTSQRSHSLSDITFRGNGEFI